ncbi:MAG: acyltransferase [Bacteroidota bacterium]|nr:acyltransferase [Bacteroidota bacterium]
MEEKIIRSASADILKVISIIAVVFIHGAFLLPSSPSYLKLFYPALRFSVPVFIFLWAFFCEKAIQRRSLKYSYLVKRFLKLLLPFTFWSLLYFLILADLHTLSLEKAITKHWTGYGFEGQYFFIILFQLTLLFNFIRKIALGLKRYPVLIAVFSFVFYFLIAYSNLFTSATIIKLGDRPFFYWLPYAVLGVIYSFESLKTKANFPIIVVFVLPAFISLEKAYFHPNKLSPYLMPSVFIVSLILVTTLLQTSIDITSLKPWLNNSINLVSKNTFGIFCLNPLVVITLGRIFQSSAYIFNFPGCFIVIPIFSTLLVLLICLIFIFLLKRIGLGILVKT